MQLNRRILAIVGVMGLVGTGAAVLVTSKAVPRARLDSITESTRHPSRVRLEVEAGRKHDAQTRVEEARAVDGVRHEGDDTEAELPRILEGIVVAGDGVVGRLYVSGCGDAAEVDAAGRWMILGDRGPCSLVVIHAGGDAAAKGSEFPIGHSHDESGIVLEAPERPVESRSQVDQDMRARAIEKIVRIRAVKDDADPVWKKRWDLMEAELMETHSIDPEDDDFRAALGLEQRE